MTIEGITNVTQKESDDVRRKAKISFLEKKKIIPLIILHIRRKYHISVKQQTKNTNVGTVAKSN
jgi:hypothetical protein